MRGDFSTRTADAVERASRTSNIRGVLHQQGKVLRDVDLTDSDLLAVGWQDAIAAAVIGNDVAAVPVDAPNGFRIEAARVTGPAATPRIEVTVHGGALWADGLPASIGTDPAGTVVRTATYFGPPVQSPAASPSSIGAGIRDAVVLETSYEELNAFQDPERLLEPALGGPDTAERIHTRSALRLYRLGPDETCCTIRSTLNAGDTGRGRLTASLLPVTVVGGECPTVATGGYTGFEHSLYRIEIAEVNPGFAPRFKYSWCNGGLVGRGTFRPAAMNPSGKDSVAIDANLAAIKGCGLTDFYLEALQFDTALGYWRTSYGVDATLDPSGQELELAATPVLGTSLPPAATPTFFRLWNGIRTMASFTTLTELADGITLQFDPPGSATYRPRDYWTFSVRAGEIANPATLIAAELPHGIEYHRVALAEIQ
ncbi:MAG TPA: hypothetical protein VJ817_10170, partial [Gemmatimonadales bacterium]|nr:hypothetical protein [Gemmatimonadales bacterium]